MKWRAGRAGGLQSPGLLSECDRSSRAPSRVGVLHAQSLFSTFCRLAQRLAPPRGKIFGVYGVVQRCADAVGTKLLQMPQRVAAQAKVACIEVYLHGNWACCARSLNTRILARNRFYRLMRGLAMGRSGKRSYLARQVVAEVRSGNDPRAGICVEGAVDLVKVLIVEHVLVPTV